MLAWQGRGGGGVDETIKSSLSVHQDLLTMVEGMRFYWLYDILDSDLVRSKPLSSWAHAVKAECKSYPSPLHTQNINL